MDQADEIPLAWPDALDSNTFYGEYKNSTYSAELTYKETIGEHRVTAGVKGRLKKLDSFENKGQDALITPFTEEKIAAVFFQDQYALSSNELLTFGVSYNTIDRNGGATDDSLLQLRLGYLYSSDNWNYKAYLFRMQFPLAPLVRYLSYPLLQDIDLQTTIGMTQEFAYTKEKQHARLILQYMQDEDSLFQDLSSVRGDDPKYFTAVFNYAYTFNLDNKMDLQLYYAQYKDFSGVDKLEDVSGYLSFANSYEDFDFYNGVVWHSNNLDWENYFDLTSSISWNVDEDLTLTIKGDNLLNKAKKTTQYTFNPITGATGSFDVSPIDQRVMIELEYMF
jgi:iron complex outermembrane receptor protein